MSINIHELHFRAKVKDSDYFVSGTYYWHINRTLCPIGDELKDIDIDHYILYPSFSDWNMPRNIEAVKIDIDTLEIMVDEKTYVSAKDYAIQVCQKKETKSIPPWTTNK